MDIAGLVIAAVGLFGVVTFYLLRRRAYGIDPVLDGLLRLQATSNNGQSIHVRDYGIFSDHGRAAIDDIADGLPGLVDKKLAEMVRRVIELYKNAERVAMPRRDVEAMELAARYFDPDQPANALLTEVSKATSRAHQLGRKRAGAG